MTNKQTDRLDPEKLTHIMELKGKTAGDAIRELRIAASTIYRHMTGEPVATPLINRYARWLGESYEALLADESGQYPQIGGLPANNHLAHLPAVRGAGPAFAPVIGVITGATFIPRELMNGFVEGGVRTQSVRLDETYPQLEHFIFQMGETFNDGIDRIDAGESLICVDASNLPIERGALYVVERTNEKGEVNFSIRSAKPFKDHAELDDGKTTITYPEEGTRIIGLVSSIVRKPRRRL